MEKELLTANRHLVAGTGLEEILGDTSIDTAGLQTATVHVSHIHKARYSIQLYMNLYEKLTKQVIPYCHYFYGQKSVLHLVVCLSTGC